MRDRLAEMQKLAVMEEGVSFEENVGNKKYRKKSKNDSIPLPLLPHKRNQQSFDLFLQTVSEIREDLHHLHVDAEQISNMHKSVLSKASWNTNETHSLNELVDRFIGRARSLRGVLTRLSDETNNIPSDGFGASRARKEQLRVLFMSFETVMLRFNEEQANYKEKSTRNISDYLRIKNIVVSDEQIEEAIESGNLAYLTKGAVLGLEEKRALFDDVKTRASDLLVLESQIRELADLFHDLHLLVVSQGETVDRIETSVNNASEFAHRAEVNVKEAVVMRKRATKTRCCLALLACVTLLVVLFILQGFVCLYTPIC